MAEHPVTRTDVRVPPTAAQRRRWWLVGGALLVVGTALTVWLALANSIGQVTVDTTAYAVDGDSSVHVEFVVHRDPGTAVSCHVEALNAKFAVVGALDLPVAATTDRSTHVATTVRTAERAVTGTVTACTKTTP